MSLAKQDGKGQEAIKNAFLNRTPALNETFYLHCMNAKCGVQGTGVVMSPNPEWVFKPPWNDKDLLRVDIRQIEIEHAWQRTHEGLLVAVGHPDYCIRMTKDQKLQAIHRDQATPDDRWSYDSQTHQWSCPHGKLFYNLCDHTMDVNGKTTYSSWNEYEFVPILTSFQ